MACFGTKLLDGISKLFGRKKAKSLEGISDYADFYWEFMKTGDVNATSYDDLPGFSDYHKMLKLFIQSQNIYDELDSEKVEKVEEMEKEEKVMKWLESQEASYSDVKHKFSDVKNWLDAHSCEHCEDDLHYACVDVTGRSEASAPVNTSFESSGSSWEVTKKPRVRSTPSDWL